jgi:hypothetical protein
MEGAGANGVAAAVASEGERGSSSTAGAGKGSDVPAGSSPPPGTHCDRGVTVGELMDNMAAWKQSLQAGSSIGPTLTSVRRLMSQKAQGDLDEEAGLVLMTTIVPE